MGGDDVGHLAYLNQFLVDGVDLGDVGDSLYSLSMLLAQLHSCQILNALSPSLLLII